MPDTTPPRTPIVRAPLMPTYADVAHAIRAMEGEPVQRVRQTINAIHDQVGTPQNPVDWSDPDAWIGERLTGEAQAFARKVWDGSGKQLNPRYLYGCYLFINNVKLLDKTGGVFRLGDRGHCFLANDMAILHELDAREGFPKLLSLVAERSPCRSGDLLPAWSDYLKAVSLFSTSRTFRDTLRRRLVNLTAREFVSREGSVYSVTTRGLQWLRSFAASPETGTVAAPTPRRTTVAEAARDYNEEQLQLFKARLMALEPAQFEHFVRGLLEAMEYEDVQVTKVSGDKGVDVVARIQFGITEITEVVQVKRTENTITRPKIDELRGALPYHKAIRGTIISLGSFAKGAQDGALYVGAAPITLIDGKRLLDLCMKHGVGLKEQAVKIYEVDEAFFAEKFGRTEEDGIVADAGVPQGSATPDGDEDEA